MWALQLLMCGTLQARALQLLGCLLLLLLLLLLCCLALLLQPAEQPKVLKPLYNREARVGLRSDRAAEGKQRVGP